MLALSLQVGFAIYRWKRGFSLSCIFFIHSIKATHHSEWPLFTENYRKKPQNVWQLTCINASLFSCCGGGVGAIAKKGRQGYPVRYVYDAYRHRPRRRLNVADLEPSFGTFHSMSGDTYSGFDEDGLPVDIQTDYDGLSRQARTVTNVPTASGSQLSRSIF